jgi:mono/diheme cytochrome c family protein
MRKELRNILWIWFLIGGLVLAILVGWHQSRTASTTASSAEFIEQGRQVYADQCASCHGADLKGQPDWRSPLPSGRLPAPPHDESGHTWHHSDEVLFRIVREGTAAVVGGGYESDMPGFGDVLSDAEIRAALTYIKSTWPEHERSYQESVSKAD